MQNKRETKKVGAPLGNACAVDATPVAVSEPEVELGIELVVVSVCEPEPISIL